MSLINHLPKICKYFFSTNYLKYQMMFFRMFSFSFNYFFIKRCKGITINFNLCDIISLCVSTMFEI
jgi:hypothetical protein